MKLASNQYMADGAMTLNFANAEVEGRHKLIDFYLHGMRPELLKVMTKWLASKPLQNPDAYAHPMAMPEYVNIYNKQDAEAQTLRKEAEANRAVAMHAGKVSDRYLMLTILFSAVLFLGGIESKFDLIQVRLMLLTLSGLLFLFSAYMKYKIPYKASLVTIVIFTFGCNEPAKNTATMVSCGAQSESVQKEQPAPPDKKLLTGDWTRTDAPYQIKIAELVDNGNLKCRYLNPDSINVGKATWITADGILKMYIELRDVNYPGSNYNLTYIPGKDLLAGKYYQAVEGVTYDVEFSRAK